MCESNGFDVLDWLRLYPPSNCQTSIAALRSYGAPPRLPATSGVYEIAAPEGSLNPSFTITVVLGASAEPSGSAITYRLPWPPILFTRATSAERSSKPFRL